MTETTTKQDTPTTAPPSPYSSDLPGAEVVVAACTPAAPASSAPMSAPISQLSPASVLHAAASGQLEVLDEVGAEALSNIRDDYGMSPLLVAVQRGSPDTVLHLVRTLGADVSCRLEGLGGMTCLHLAAERGDEGLMLETLLGELGEHVGMPGVNVGDGQRFTPLHLACIVGDLSAARCLLRHGADVTARNDKGSTPLHWACSRGHTKILKLLAGVYGANFACTAENGSTPLHWAASRNKRAVMRILLATYCAQVEVKDDKGCTPALMAALNGHLKAVELLVDGYHAKVTTHDKKRTNMLHAACEMGHLRLADVLVERYKIALEEEDKKGMTALARAASKNQVEVFRLLVDKYGARLDTHTTRGSGLLHVACEGGALDVAKLLLEEYRFEVDARNGDGETSALLAASRGHSEVLALVEHHGASLEAVDSRGVGVLHKACQACQGGTASVLLEAYGISADKADPTGTTPLHLAARGGDASLAQLLTGPIGRADPSLRDGDGNQALHIAAACGHLDVVKVMVEKAGADLEARNASDKSVLDLAVGEANTEIADYLRNMLPDGGEQHDRCRSKAGFKRAGRWMELARADGFLEDASLESVLLLPIPTLLKLGRFPSYYDASRKKLLIRASDASPHARVLMVSHPCELPGNPDPSGRQFAALLRFLEQSRHEADSDEKQGQGAGGGGDNVHDEKVVEGDDNRSREARFGYAWMAFSCTGSNRIKPTFKTHLHNLITAWCLADHVLVLPETVTIRRMNGLACTDLMSYIDRGWCCVELLCALHLAVPITIHMALGDETPTGKTGGCHSSTFESSASAPQGSVFRDAPGACGTGRDEHRFASVFESLGVSSHAAVLSEPPSEGAPARVTGDPPKDAIAVGTLISRAVESASKRLSPLLLGGAQYAEAQSAGEAQAISQLPVAPPLYSVPLASSPSPSPLPSLSTCAHNEAANFIRTDDRQATDGGFAPALPLLPLTSASYPSSLRACGSNDRCTDDSDRITGRRTPAASGVFIPLGGELSSSNRAFRRKEGTLGAHQEEPESVLAIADLLWSAEAELHVDSIVSLAATFLKSLHAEVSTQSPPIHVATEGLVVSEKPPESGIVGGTALDARRPKSAAQLLTRIMSLSLCKQDVEEDAAEADSSGGDAGWAFFSVVSLLRELHNKLGNFSGAHEKMDAVNTLLLAGCYCKGMSCTRGGSRESPRHVRVRNRIRRSPTPPRSDRRRRSRSPTESRPGETRDTPIRFADSVPSCQVS